MQVLGSRFQAMYPCGFGIVYKGCKISGMKNERPRIDKNSPLNSRREKIGWVHHKKFT